MLIHSMICRIVVIVVAVCGMMSIVVGIAVVCIGIIVAAAALVGIFLFSIPFGIWIICEISLCGHIYR